MHAFEDLHAEVLQHLDTDVVNVEIVCGAIDIEAERPAICDVAVDRAERWCVHRGIEHPHERWHVDEPNPADVAPVPGDECLDEATWGVDAHASLGHRPMHPAEFGGGGGQGNDAVTAMWAVVDVLHEDDTEIGRLADGFGEEAAIHVGMSARFEHELAAVVVGVVLEP